MDRLNRTLAGCGLMLLVAAGGCRSTRPEVPPGRSYSGDGRQAPPINFSSDPHPMTGPGMAAGGPGSAQYGTPGPAASANYGAPTGNQFGPPGTSLGDGQMPPGVGLPAGGPEVSSMPSSGLGAPSGGLGAPSGGSLMNGANPGAGPMGGPGMPGTAP